MASQCFNITHSPLLFRFSFLFVMREQKETCRGLVKKTCTFIKENRSLLVTENKDQLFAIICKYLPDSHHLYQTMEGASCYRCRANTSKGMSWQRDQIFAVHMKKLTKISFNKLIWLRQKEDHLHYCRWHVFVSQLSFNLVICTSATKSNIEIKANHKLIYDKS